MTEMDYREYQLHVVIAGRPMQTDGRGLSPLDLRGAI
jgi:hypothetical protein